jgi:sentrin-specific protease 1
MNDDMPDVIDLTVEEPRNTSTDDHSGSVDATRLSLSAALRALYIRHVVPRYECENMLKPLTDDQNSRVNAALSAKDDQKLVEKSFGKGNHVVIRGKDAKRMKPGTWLNDTMIDFTLAVVAERAGNVCALGTHFINKLYKDSQQYAYENVQKWTSIEKLGYDILDREKIFIPVNQGNNHWVLVVVDLLKRTVSYYDSFGEKDVECTTNVVKWIKNVYSKQNDAERKWNVIYVSNPKQSNKYDCGVFVCKYAEYAALGCKIDFEESNMEYFRRRILIDALEAGSSEEGSRR